MSIGDAKIVSIFFKKKKNIPTNIANLIHDSSNILQDTGGEIWINSYIERS